jgi:hypothetical protein
MRVLVAIALGGMVASCTFPDVTFGDASVAADAAPEAQGSDAGGEAGDPCDEDHDGYKAEGAACGGNDCNDHDPRANPGQTQFITDVPDAAPWGDWNCDTKLEKLFATPVACTAGLACNTAEGFLNTDQGCGITADYVKCAGLCSLTDAGTRTQGCR